MKRRRKQSSGGGGGRKGGDGGGGGGGPVMSFSGPSYFRESFGLSMSSLSQVKEKVNKKRKVMMVTGIQKLVLLNIPQRER
jgi:hypothetical protein